MSDIDVVEKKTDQGMKRMISKRKPYVVNYWDNDYSNQICITFNSGEKVKIDFTGINGKGYSDSSELVNTVGKAIRRTLKARVHELFPEAYEMIDLDEAIKYDPELGRIVGTYGPVQPGD